MSLYAIGVVVLAIIAGVWVLGRKLRRAGQDEVRADVATETVEVLQDMADAAANAPTGKPAILDRLRNGGGL